ncbi:hypothetical protein IHE45_14G091500 [Dioscorea alata]|uniref:Uncharacterized protein n=1 Tax=Dioscorea alata TaxID=55571 RepID=A0ACB7UT90_DIOAL|nr:hypothetical protein IHE45_14G091500 [Dioscorea alata]
MELHSPAIMVKKLWSILRVAFLMMRKGLMSKRKFILYMNLMIKKGKLSGKKTFAIIFNNHHYSPSQGFGLQENEFSCSNSPNPITYTFRKKRYYNYFPCIHSIVEDPNENPCPAFAFHGTEFTPHILMSPCSLEEVGRESIDDEAEEFIKRFYEQLHAQSHFGLIDVP